MGLVNVHCNHQVREAVGSRCCAPVTTCAARLPGIIHPHPHPLLPAGEGEFIPVATGRIRPRAVIQPDHSNPCAMHEMESPLPFMGGPGRGCMNRLWKPRFSLSHKKAPRVRGFVVLVSDYAVLRLLCPLGKSDLHKGYLDAISSSCLALMTWPSRPASLPLLP